MAINNFTVSVIELQIPEIRFTKIYNYIRDICNCCTDIWK